MHSVGRVQCPLKVMVIVNREKMIEQKRETKLKSIITSH